MPCDSSYLEPDARESELQFAAQLTLFVLSKLPQHTLSRDDYVSLVKTSQDIYAKEDFVPVLCSFIKNMTDEQREQIMYNAHDKFSRDLADWWEDHQEADRKREAREAEQRRMEQIRQRALTKLSPEEIEVLNL